MSVHQLKDGRWVVAFRKGTMQDTPNTTRLYFGRGLEGEQRARDKEIELGLRPWTRRTPKRSSTAFRDLFQAYLEARTGHISESSRIKLIEKMTTIILPALGHLQALRITPDRIDRYVITRLRTPVKRYMGRGEYQIVTDIETGQPRTIKRSTVNRELADIKAVLNWAANRKRRLIEYNPLAGYELPKRDDAIILPPTKSEVELILAHAADHLARALLISYYTGLRPGRVELLSLRWTDIDWDESAILIRSAVKGGPRQRLVPLHPSFASRLRSWYKEDRNPAGLIVQYRGRAIKRIQKSFDRAKQRAGITRRLRPYDFRHAFATNLLRNRGDLKGTSEILGHSRPDTTMRIYQHTDMALHRAIIERLPALEVKKAGD